MYCPRAASGIEANKLWFDRNEFNAIRYYGSSGGLSVPESDARHGYYGLTGFPTSWWNGTTTVVGAGTDVINGVPYRAIIENALAEPSSFKITVNSVDFTTPTGTIDFDIEVMETMADISNMWVRMAVTEDDVFYDSVDDWHQDVVRDMPADVALTVGTLGQIQNVQAQFDVDPTWVPEKMEVVIFIQDDDDKRIETSATTSPTADYALGYYALGERIAVGPAVGTYTYDRFRVYNMGTTTDTYTVSVAMEGAGSETWIGALCDDSICYGETFSTSLRPGEYAELYLDITPNSSGYANATVTLTQDNWPGDFPRTIGYTYMTNDLDVLFVDDDGGETHDNYYVDALAANSISYGFWPRGNGAPTAQLLDNFQVVVWGTAFAFPTLDESDRAALGTFLDNGGKLFLTGQDIGWELNDTGGDAYAWYQNYLHAIFVNDDTNDYTLNGVSGDPVSDGIDLVIQGGDGANNQDYPSDIDPGDEFASVIWTYDANRNAAIKADTGTYRVVYFAFGFEAIDNAADRQATMSRVINWLMNGAAEVGDELSSVGSWVAGSPNPLQAGATIQFAVPASGPADLRVFAADGRAIRTLFEGETTAGVHHVHWDGTDHAGNRVPAGVYFYRLKTEEGTHAEKTVVID